MSCILNARCPQVIHPHLILCKRFLVLIDRGHIFRDRQKPSDDSFAQGHFKCNVAAMRTKTSRCSSSAACTVLSACKILYFCKTLTSPLRFYLYASRQQGKQQWAFLFGLSHNCSQTDISPHDSPPYRNQGVSFHHKTEDTSSSTWPSEFSYYSIMVISGNQ